MTDDEQGEQEPVSTHEWIRSLAIVVLAAAVIVGLGAWVVFSFVLTCSCTRPA